MKIIDIIAAQKDCVENCGYSTKTTLSKPSLEDIICESNERWSEDESDSDENDELNLSFREGMKRSASDEFCHDLKRIKFDNNVRDLTNNLVSFQLDLVLKVDTNESAEDIRNSQVSELPGSSERGDKRVQVTDENS
jgi:hypothetical protein